MTYAFFVALIVALVQTVRATITKNKLAEETRLKLAFEDLSKTYGDVLENKKREYNRALETIGACEDPVAIRYLVHKLLDDPWYGDVPSGASPAVDTSGD